MASTLFPGLDAFALKPTDHDSLQGWMGAVTWSSDSEGTDQGHDAAVRTPTMRLGWGCSALFTSVRTGVVSLDPDGFGEQILVPLRVRAGSGDAAVIRGRTNNESCRSLQMEISPLRE